MISDKKTPVVHQIAFVLKGGGLAVPEGSGRLRNKTWGINTIADNLYACGEKHKLRTAISPYFTPQPLQIGPEIELVGI